jgi:ribose 5-phosphate isomerase B
LRSTPEQKALPAPVMATTETIARYSREHNGANVLTLGSKTISNDQMHEIVRAWLSTDLTEERHRKRVGKIDAVERQYQR